jgi:hypothetical protein
MIQRSEPSPERRQFSVFAETALCAQKTLGLGEEIKNGHAPRVTKHSGSQVGRRRYAPHQQAI